MCENFGEDYCANFAWITQGYYPADSLLSQAYYMQNGIESFQDYIPLDEYASGTRKSEPADLSVVKDVKVNLIVGDQDWTAPLSEGQRIFEELGCADCDKTAPKNLVIQEGWDHEAFEVGNRTPGFIDVLVDAIEQGNWASPEDDLYEYKSDIEKYDSDEMDEYYDAMASVAMWGNIGFLMTAISHTIHPALQLFRYRSASDYYNLGEDVWGVDGINWWSLYNTIANYSLLSIGSILSITQLLSMFGVAVETNLMLWDYATNIVAPILGAVVSGLVFWAYDSAYQSCSVDSVANACTVQAAIELEMTQCAVMELAFGAALMESAEGWMMAQFMALPEES